MVIGDQQGLPGWQIGALRAAFSACVLAGSLASGMARRVLAPRTLMLLELWGWLGPFAFLIWPSVYLLAASMLPVGLAIPVTDSVVVGYRLAITPSRLVGRVESVRSSIALALAPFGALTAGLLLDAVPPRIAILALAATAVPLALWGTLSPAIRSGPRGRQPVSAWRSGGRRWSTSGYTPYSPGNRRPRWRSCPPCRRRGRDRRA